MAEIDWPGLRAAAAVVGIRAAARQASENLQPDEQNRFVERVMKRASREGWETAKKAAIASADANVRKMSAPVRTGVETLSAAVQSGDVKDGSLLTMHERRTFLARVVRTPVGKIDENDPLAQKVKRIPTPYGERVEIETPGKLEALMDDARLAGELIERQEIMVAGVVTQVAPEKRAELLRAVRERDRLLAEGQGKE